MYQWFTLYPMYLANSQHYFVSADMIFFIFFVRYNNMCAECCVFAGYWVLHVGCNTMFAGYWVLHVRYNTMFAGYWVSHVRYSTMFAWYWVLHVGCNTMFAGYWVLLIDYTMAKVVSSCISGRPCCILQRVMCVVHTARRPQV